MALDETDLDALVAEAAAILDEAAKPFVAGHGADSAVQKKGNDFATEVDLAIERQVVEALGSRTGIGVHGEEFGGADIDSPLVWVLDPIDGTFNYAAGLPTAAILLGLVRDGEPVAGLTWLPFTDQRFTAVVGKPLYANGVAQPPLEAGRSCPTVVVGTGTFDIDSRGALSRPISARDHRTAEPASARGCGCTARSASTWLTPRQASSAAPSTSAATSGTTRPVSRWCGLRAASSPIWRATTGRRRRGRALAGAPGVHAEILEIVASVGRPEDYR